MHRSVLSSASWLICLMLLTLLVDLSLLSVSRSRKFGRCFPRPRPIRYRYYMVSIEVYWHKGELASFGLRVSSDYDARSSAHGVRRYCHCLLVFWGAVKRTKMPKLRNGSKGDSNPGSLACESGILPLSYRAPRKKRFRLVEIHNVTRSEINWHQRQ